MLHPVPSQPLTLTFTAFSLRTLFLQSLGWQAHFSHCAQTSRSCWILGAVGKRFSDAFISEPLGCTCVHSKDSGGHLVAEARGSVLAIKGSRFYFCPELVIDWTSGSEPRVLVRHPVSSSGVLAESPVSHGCLVCETKLLDEL